MYGSIRISVDIKPLNCYIIREVHPPPTVDENLAQLSDAKMFSKLDANSGFWQIPLSENSKLLVILDLEIDQETYLQYLNLNL